MSIEKARKQELIKNYQQHGKDTGSSEVQISLLTERINYLTEHSQRNPKDHNSRRGFLLLVGKRKRLLDYLKRENFARYQEVVKRLELRK